MFGQRDESGTQQTIADTSNATSAQMPGTVPGVSDFDLSKLSADLAAPVTPSFGQTTTPTVPPVVSQPVVSPVMAPAIPESTEDLARMKQEALQQLQPLVEKLQQSPEEEFRTLMMMIQATDDKTMLGKALAAAKKISDEKIRAQAMLDVINEINYFTQTASQQ